MTSGPWFTTWLRRYRESPGAIGDLARDIAVDSEWPRTRGDLEIFRSYLGERDASLAAVEVLEMAWEMFQADHPPGARPILDAWRDRNSLKVWCAFCRIDHVHSVCSGDPGCRSVRVKPAGRRLAPVRLDLATGIESPIAAQGRHTRMVGTFFEKLENGGDRVWPGFRWKLMFSAEGWISYDLRHPGEGVVPE